MKNTAIRLEKFRSIHEINENIWNSINSKDDLFHSHRFIKSVEDAKVENSKFWYFLFYSEDELIASAVLSSFTVSLDLFVGGIIGNAIRGVRKIIPQFLKVKVLFCGTPISLGQKNIVIRKPVFSKDIFTLLEQSMTSISKTENIGFMCLKEFMENETEIFDEIEGFGFFKAFSIPYVSLDIKWESLNEYLQQMRHNYRRPIILSLQKIGIKNINNLTLCDQPTSITFPKLKIGGRELCSPAKFHSLYLQVMKKTEIKLEILNKEFFEELYDNLGKGLEILILEEGDNILGACILSTIEDRMVFMLVGLDYEKRDEFDVYFNLIYAIISHAISKGAKTLDLGQTSYWVKQRIGGICEQEYLYIKSHDWVIHNLLKLLRPIVFPELTFIKPRVFKQIDTVNH